MKDHVFLKMVRSNGGYSSDGEATRAANAVFGTVKSWLPPSASEKMRKVLPGDACQLWQYSPSAFGSGHMQSVMKEQSARMLHFILKIQQLGKYQSSRDAQRAACSVLKSLAGAIAEEPRRFVLQAFPPEIMEVCPARAGAASGKVRAA